MLPNNKSTYFKLEIKSSLSGTKRIALVRNIIILSIIIMIFKPFSLSTSLIGIPKLFR